MMMGRSRPSKVAKGARCRWHGRQQAGAGVCAACLWDRLSRLSLSASLPSVVVRGCGDQEEEEYEYAEGASSCSEASTDYSSEGSSGCSSECASPAAAPAGFHDEMRRAAAAASRVSLLTRHERVVGDADAVAAFLATRREQERRRRTAATSFWAKLLHATTRGGGAKKQQQEEGCSLAHSKTLHHERAAAAAKWALF